MRKQYTATTHSLCFTYTHAAHNLHVTQTYVHNKLFTMYYILLLNNVELDHTYAMTHQLQGYTMSGNFVMCHYTYN